MIRGVGFSLVAALALMGMAPRASELDPSGWTFSGLNATELKKAVDNNLDTYWESNGPQTPGTAVLIDLGRSVQLYRLFLTPGRELSKFPRSLNVYVGDSPETLRLVAQEHALPKEDKARYGGEAMAINDCSLLRFPPAQGRFVKLEIGPNGAGLPWAIAEMDIHAAGRAVTPRERTAVVVDGRFIRSADGKPVPFSPLKAAAEDLQYYLMELTDAPVDVVAAEDAGVRSGLCFRLVTPPPEQVPAPVPDPRDLEDVSVVRVGNEVRISGPTQRAVLFGAYEFLNSQGVRWLYPDPHGDVVPARRRLDLSVLPITYRPPFSVRGYMAGGIPGIPQDEYRRFLMRHRLTMGENYTGCSLGTIPRNNCAFGWAHTMGGMFQSGGKSLEESHPDWWPGPYREGWYRVPCTTKPEVVDYAYACIEDAIRKRAADRLPAYQGVSVHPNDSPCFCECPRCEAAFGKPERVDPDGAAESNGSWNYSDHHFHLINELAKRLQKDHPELFLKTLAYANHERPPTKTAKLPDNVMVDICPWWAPLPVDAPCNVRYRDLIRSWKPWCKSLGIWSYVLIYSDTTFGYPAGEKSLVVPNVRALVSQNAFYRDVGVRLVSTQVMGPQSHWPWGLYAFSRTTWRPDEKAETILDDFFRGYYGDAWKPMLTWYKTLENRAIEKNIDVSAPDPQLIGTDTIGNLRALLAQAARKAHRWYEKERVEQARSDTEWTFAKGQWKTRTDRPYPCYRLSQAPVVDGKLDEAVWQTAPELQGFRIAATRIDDQRPGRFALRSPTRFRMGWDDDYLYLGIVCQEPAPEKSREAAAKDSKFEYRDAVEIFFAPEAPPYYRQTMVSSAGFVWGPVKIRQVNSHQPVEHPGLAFKTAYTADGWTIEARFPWATLAASPPADGALWPANLVRVSKEGGSLGEQYSSWSDLPRFHFHQYNLGTWSLIQFRNTVLAAETAAELGTTLNRDFTNAGTADTEHLRQLAAFNAKTQGRENLATKAKGAALFGVSDDVWDNGNRQRRHLEVVWDKAPPTIDAVRIVWSGRNMYRRWYSLEYWDGERYRLLEERRNNQAEISTHEFAPVTAGRLRLTVWADLEGWQQMAMVKAIEVYGP